MTAVVDEIAAQRIVPVIRTADADDAIATARACATAGMRVIELTHTTGDVERALEALRGAGLILGVGTVTDAGQVTAAANAGADFVVSFAAPEGMVRAANELGLVAIPGALTPTEVLACVDAGAAAVKLFPARAITPGYLRDLRTVLPGLRVLVTGGLAATAEGIGPWLDAGALGVGLGSALGTAAGAGAAEVERRARAALQLLHPALADIS